MREEKRELVTDFGTLRAGMLIVMKPCAWCASSHRHMLMKMTTEPAESADGTVDCEPSWEVEPAAPCDPDAQWMIDAGSVAERRVYRIIDDTDSSTSTTRTRKTTTPKKLERQR